MRVVAVGISRASRPDVSPLPFAASDARAFADATRSVATVKLLTDHEATAVKVTSALQWLSNSATETPQIFFLVAQVRRLNEQLQVELDNDSIPLGELVHLATHGSAGRTILILDIFRGANCKPPISSDEIAALLPAQVPSMAIVADDGTNESYVSGELQAGIFAHHVTEAFSGTMSASRNEEGILTVASLKKYLASAIPPSLSRAFAEPKSQFPLFIGGTDAFELAAPGKQPAEVSAKKPPFSDVRVTLEQSVPVKSLGGFRKSVHTVPSDTFASSREWVARLAEPDLVRELEETSKRLRKSFGYKRKELRADGPSGGGASILTPDFSYHITVQQHAAKPNQAILKRTLSEIRNVDRLADPNCESAFPQGFTSLFQPFQTPANIEELVDLLEEESPPNISEIDYPTDLSYCELQIAGFDGRVRIERQGVTITASSPSSPASLASQYLLVKQFLG